jgi:tRNA(His) 5'-end guanylyltransferase
MAESTNNKPNYSGGIRSMYSDIFTELGIRLRQGIHTHQRMVSRQNRCQMLQSLDCFQYFQWMQQESKIQN